MNQGVGFVGQKVYAVSKRNIQERYSMTLLTSFIGTPCFIEFRNESNTQFDFLTFIMQAIEGEYIKQGDILVFDNASVHCGREIKELLQGLQNLVGFSLKLLPTYSPELNPCELVFNYVKTHLRYSYDENYTLKENAIIALSKVSSETMKKFYQHCTSHCNALNLNLIEFAQRRRQE